MRKKGLIFLASFLVMCRMLSGAETLVVGTVRNLADKLPLEAVNVYFEGTKKGTQTDQEGFYMLKSQGNETVLVFSSVGFKSKKVKIRPGETNGINIELQEDVNLLNELFVLPGINPALDMMKKVWKRNQETKVILDKFNPASETQLSIFRKKVHGNRKTDEMLFNDNGFQHDPSLYLLLYQISGMSGNMNDTSAYTITQDQNYINLLLEKFTGEINRQLDFTANSMILFSRTFVSPLAPGANSYYRYYLSDSVEVENKKRYTIRYFSKNPAVSAFNGELTIDSVSMGVVGIKASLPGNINLNYIQKMDIVQRFRFEENIGWIPAEIRLLANMDYRMMSPEEEKQEGVHYFVRKKFNTEFDKANIQQIKPLDTNEQTQQQNVEIDSDLEPFLNAARWIADAIVTGYFSVGKIDIGKINQIARLTENEGFRLSLPFRTNEKLFKNISLGGYGGVSMLDGKLSYGLEAGIKLPGKKKSVLSMQYFTDRHNPDFNLNNYVIREEPYFSTDEALLTTLFAFRKGGIVTPRKTLEMQWMKDWTPDFETSLFYRNQQYFHDLRFPVLFNGQEFPSVRIHSLTLFARYSSGEKTYEDHLQRIYINNNKPIWTFFGEIGKPVLPVATSGYLKFEVNVRQTLNFPSGQWNWMFEGGIMTGDLPYFLLRIPVGRRSVNFDRNAFSMMEPREFAMDKYLSLNQELVFNGILFNKIPFIKTLKLRELVSLKCLTGSLSPQYLLSTDLPPGMKAFPGFYAETGIGISNLFRVFSVQVVRRLTNAEQNKWGMIAGVRVHF